MATTEVEVLQIDTGQSVKSVQSLKQEIRQLKSDLLNLDKGTVQYNDTLLKLGNATHDLKEIQEQTAATNNDFGTMVGNTTRAIAGMSGAVAAVTGTLSLMGVQIGDDAKLMKILVSAMSITQGVAAIDSGVKAFKALKISIQAATAAQKGFNVAALKNPYLLIGAAVIAAITGIVTAIKKQEKAEKEQYEARMEQLRKLTQAEANRAVTEAATAAELAKYGNEWKRRTKEEIELEKDKLRLQREDNEAAYNNINKEVQAAKDRVKAAEEHVRAIKEQGVANEAAEIYLNKYKAELNGLTKQQNEYANAINDANRKLNVLNNTEGKASEAKKTNTKAAKDEYTAYEKLLNEIELLVATGEDEGEVLQQKIQVEKEHLTELKRGTEAYDKQLIKIAQLNTAYVDYLHNVETATHEEKLNAIERQKNTELQTAELKRLQEESKNILLSSGSAKTEPTTYSGIDEQHDTKAAIYQSEYETKLEYLNATYNAELEAFNAELELSTTTAERKKELLSEIELLTAEHNLTLNELNAEKNEKDLENDRATQEAKKTLMQQNVNFAVTMANQLAGVISSLADAQEEGTKEQKNLQVAAAIINTLAGAAGGFAQAVATYPPPYGPILGAVTMAATIATGMAQVAKMKQTKVSKSANASTPSSTTVQSISNTPTNVRQTSPQWNDEEYIGEKVQQTSDNNNTTVTLVYSDLQTMEANNREVTAANTI